MMETTTTAQLPEHYLEAQRAAVEAVEVGRATLEETDRQGEQLKNAHRLADHTQYALDKSARILRGMTWSGWFQNMLSRDVKTPPPPSIVSMEDVPPFAEPAAQAIQNYRANLSVLSDCETTEQRQTCLTVCNNMFDAAAKQVEQLRVDNNPTVVQQLSQELSRLRQHQKEVVQRYRQVEQKKQEYASTLSLEQSTFSRQQDEHLDFLATNLNELSVMASNLNAQMSHHNQLMSYLDDKTDLIHEKTRMVTRRADRTAQKKSWTPPKKIFDKWISVKHVESGKYLSVAEGGGLVLSDTFHPEKCVFGVWMRKSGLFGLKNKWSGRLAGQTLLGSLTCSASSFGQREEWQADDNWQASKLLIASAGWGQGGYLKGRPKDGSLSIVSDRSQGSTWSLVEVQNETSSSFH